MFTLQIEHLVRDFTSWKQAFDRYDSFREQSHVCRYRIFRSVIDPNYVIIHLDFDHSSEADTFLAAMRQLWGRVERKLIDSPMWFKP